MKNCRDNYFLSSNEIHYAVRKTTNRNPSQFFMKLAVNEGISYQLVQSLFDAQNEVMTQTSPFAFVGNVLLINIRFSLLANCERVSHLLGQNSSFDHRPGRPDILVDLKRRKPTI